MNELLLLAPVAAALLPTLLRPDGFLFLGRFRGMAFAAGMELAAVGIAFLMGSVYGRLVALGTGRLATRGAFSLCRHPTYAWVIWSVSPACALLLNSWLFLPVVPLAYVLARLAVKKDDDALWERFGREFAAYEVRVRPLFPLPRLRPIRLHRLLKAFFILSGLGLYMLAAYFAAVRPVMLRFGASRAEAGAAIPGDEFVAHPRLRYTQAVDIKAPAEEAWKWLVQVGDGSSTRIHAELQGLKAGDRILLAPGVGMTVAEIEPARLLVLVEDPKHHEAVTNASWTYVLQPRPGNRCRLVVRFRGSFAPGFVSRLLNGIVNELGGASIRQPAMLDGIRMRAERAFKALP